MSVKSVSPPNASANTPAQPARAQAEQAVGELLFAAANLARQAGVDPEQALQKANEAFCTAAGPVA